MGSRMTGATRPRLIRVEHIMGTAIGIDVRDPDFDPEVVDNAFGRLRAIDEIFSPYRPDSEISRLARGELPEAECEPEVRWVLGLCDDLARTTKGYFDARRHRADGGLDPSGLVKGWALEEAAWMLEAAGATNFSVNGGGDIVARGEPEPGRPWRVGIRHPRERDRVAAVLAIRAGAVATSGGYERGDHIVDPHSGVSPRALASMTVVGPSLTYADVFATTAFAMGGDGIDWVAGQEGYGAYAITGDDRAIWTDLVDRMLVPADGARQRADEPECSAGA